MRLYLTFLVTTFLLPCAFAVSINCDTSYLLESGTNHSLNLLFHNGGGSWSGYYRPYINFELDKHGELLGMNYDAKEVVITEISEAILLANIEIRQVYPKLMRAECTIDTSI